MDQKELHKRLVGAGYVASVAMGIQLLTTVGYIAYAVAAATGGINRTDDSVAAFGFVGFLIATTLTIVIALKFALSALRGYFDNSGASQ